MITQHLKIYGHVQGVFFRESMARKAQQLNITGWVRNRIDGTVESIAQGTPEAVTTLIEWARTGSELARVDHIEISESSGNFTSFEKRNTV